MPQRDKQEHNDIDTSSLLSQDAAGICKSPNILTGILLRAAATAVAPATVVAPATAVALAMAVLPTAVVTTRVLQWVVMHSTIVRPA